MVSLRSEPSAQVRNPCAFFVAQPHLVEQLVSTRRIEFQMHVGQLRPVETATGGYRHRLLHDAEAQVDDFVQLVAVEGQRDRLPEPLILEQLALAGIAMVLVGHHVVLVGVQRGGGPDVHVVAVRARPQIGHQVHAHGLIERGPVDLAGQCLGTAQLEVGDQQRHQTVDVGQLVVLGVDAPEVGIALGNDAILGHLRGHPGIDGRRLGSTRSVLRMCGAVVEVEYPGVEAGGLGVGLRVVAVRHVKLLGVVAREVERALPRILQVLVAYPVHLEEVRFGVGEGETHRGVVDHVHRAALPESQGLRKEVGVHDHVVVGKGDVRGGERHAVRPLGALPQLHGEDAEVVAEVPSFQQPRPRRDHVLLQERQRTTADEGEAPRRCRIPTARRQAVRFGSAAPKPGSAAASCRPCSSRTPATSRAAGWRIRRVASRQWRGRPVRPASADAGPRHESSTMLKTGSDGSDGSTRHRRTPLLVCNTTIARPIGRLACRETRA